MSEHTPTPWRLSARNGWDVATSKRDGVLLCLSYNNPANMAFAVHAANCHDELLQACKNLAATKDDPRFPEYNHEAMNRGLEERQITNLSDAMAFGWACAVVKINEWIQNETGEVLAKAQ